MYHINTRRGHEDAMFVAVLARLRVGGATAADIDFLRTVTRTCDPSKYYIIKYISKAASPATAPERNRDESTGGMGHIGMDHIGRKAADRRACRLGRLAAHAAWRAPVIQHTRLPSLRPLRLELNGIKKYYFCATESQARGAPATLLMVEVSIDIKSKHLAAVFKAAPVGPALLQFVSQFKEVLARHRLLAA